MTQQCRDGTGTEFSQWLRRKQEIDSSLGYVATNLDYIWFNHNKDRYMAIEEKRYMHDLKPYQARVFRKIDKVLKNDPHYQGFHLVQFEETSPSDGEIHVDKEFIDYENFLKFLCFEASNETYYSYFDKIRTRKLQETRFRRAFCNHGAVQLPET